MRNYNKIQYKTKEQINKFFSKISSSIDEENIKRTVHECGFGILKTGSMMLSEISRAINEPILIKKTVERLSRNLQKHEFFLDLENKHIENLSGLIEDGDLLVIDGGDLQKKYGVAFEKMCGIRDGSEDKTSKGYWLFSASIVKANRQDILPLSLRVYSTKEDGFLSQNHVKEKLRRFILERLQANVIVVEDRAGSDYKNLRKYGEKQDFVIRAMDRNIIVNDKEVNLYEYANNLELPYAMTVTNIKNGKGIVHAIQYAIQKITIRDLELTAVIMRLDDHNACVLLTNQKITRMSECNFGKKIIRQYGARWGIEEYFRLIKSQFELENIRIRNLTGIKNLVCISMIASCFVTVLHSFRVRTKKLSRIILKAAKSIREEVRFYMYRMAEGIKRVLSAGRKRVFLFEHYKKIPPINRQLCFAGL